MAAIEAERDYARRLARDLAHFPPAIVEEKIARAVYHAFGHSPDQKEIQEWVETGTFVTRR